MNGQAADASAKCACDETVPAKGGPSQAFRIETGKRIVFMADQKKQGVLGYVFLIPSLAAFCVFMFYPLFYISLPKIVNVIWKKIVYFVILKGNVMFCLIE